VSKERDLILPGISQPGGVWADIGSGSGIFTLVLRRLLGPEVRIYSVDRDTKALEKQHRAMDAQFPDTAITYLNNDFTRPLELPPLDGMLMANALHFVPFERQGAVFRQLRGHLRPDGGVFLIVEYESRRGNPWVPYPVDYESFQFLAGEAGLHDIHRLAIAPSTFMSAMYSAIGVTRQ
jgi:ubiquinone/menaquinone biosynthesis C-methylase UbiE